MPLPNFKKKYSCLPTGAKKKTTGKQLFGDIRSFKIQYLKIFIFLVLKIGINFQWLNYLTFENFALSYAYDHGPS